MSQDLYRTLQKQLDTYSLGFPSTESGVEIELLRELFSEDDANVLAATITGWYTTVYEPTFAAAE